MAMTLQWIGISILITTFALSLIRVLPFNGVVDLFWDGVAYVCLLVGNLMQNDTWGYTFAALWAVLLVAWAYRVYRAYVIWRLGRLLQGMFATVLAQHLAQGDTEQAALDAFAGKEWQVKDGKLVEVPPEESESP